MRHIETEMMSLALDGLLDQTEERILYLHLSGCASCRAEWEVWQTIEQKFKAAPLVMPPPGFVTRWEQTLALAEARHELVRRRVVSLLGLLGTGLWLWAAMSLFCLVAGGIWLAMQPGVAAGVIHGLRVLFYTLGYLIEGIRELLFTILIGPAGVLLILSAMTAIGLGLVWLKLVPGYMLAHSQHATRNT